MEMKWFLIHQFNSSDFITEIIWDITHLIIWFSIQLIFVFNYITDSNIPEKSHRSDQVQFDQELIRSDESSDYNGGGRRWVGVRVLVTSQLMPPHNEK